MAAPIGGRLAGRRTLAGRLAIAGAVACGAGLLMLSAWTEQTPSMLRIAALAVQGVGLGLFQLGYSDIVTAALPLRDRGVAGSLVLLTRTLGTVTSASHLPGVRNPQRDIHLPRRHPENISVCSPAGIYRGGSAGIFPAKGRAGQVTGPACNDRNRGHNGTHPKPLDE